MITVIPAAEPSPASAAHLLPCDIQYSGGAPVSRYFKPTATEAAFRGRHLCGVELKLPAGYSGALLQDTKLASVADGEERRWMHRGTIDSFSLWKHDEKPQEDDPLLNVMRWANVASVLHADHGEPEEAE